MALDRFSNIKEIQETDGVVRGIVWNEADLDILQLDVKHITPEERPVVEIHLYSIGDDSNYITGGCIDDFEIVKNKLHINYGKACQSLGIERGHFEVVVNVYKNLLGSKDEPDLYIKEISDDRREIEFQALPNTDLDIPKYLESFGSGVYTETLYKTEIDGNGNEIDVLDEEGVPQVEAHVERPLSDDIAINFGENGLYKIINQKEWGDNNFVARLYKPLPDDIKVKQSSWAVEQLSDSYIDNINLVGPGAEDVASRKLLGPNFNLDPKSGTITETDFRSWNDLLDANTSTSQQIIDTIFSGSMHDALGIDYSGFQNFIHFSSAKERIANFQYKLSQIEYYDGRLETLNSATGTDANSLQNNVITNTNRRANVIGSFDGFEKWLYYEPTASIFTHHPGVYDDSQLSAGASIGSNYNTAGIYRADGGFLGAKTYRLEPWPKFLSGSKYHLYDVTSSLGEAWYNGWTMSASLYDSENNKALVKTIPEHIRLDVNNDQYELFVNMMGQHFDILYSHIENLTKVYKPQEHPQIGQSKDTLYQVAKSLGWTLENGKQASQLWQYKLGVDSGSGAYASTGALFSKSDEAITTEVWRRIVNNLPFLLKTKGTTRSIKALMNTYGIPQTLLSIREYGGPKMDAESPTLIEDRFSYALQLTDGARVDVPHTYAQDKQGIYGAVDTEYPIQTHQLRFKPAHKASMLLMSNVYAASPGGTEGPNWHVAIQHTSSWSGSSDYGRVIFSTAIDNTGGASGSWTEMLPLFDGDFWNLQIGYTTPGIHFNTGSNLDTTYTLRVQKASDYIKGKIIHTGSLSITPTTGSHYAKWSKNNETRRLIIGGSTGSTGAVQNGVMAVVTGAMAQQLNINDVVVSTGGTTPIPKVAPVIYSGSIQEYRQWIEPITKATFDFHTLNPSSYVAASSPTSSFDTLVMHYPFGTDSNAINHQLPQHRMVSSSHPNQKVLDFSVPVGDSFNTYSTMSNFPTPLNSERGNYEPVEETYYIQGVSLGGNVPRSQKIRIESNELIRTLSPKTTAERSRFDRAPVDTNRLGLFYSVADQINKEIFNHIGDVALDNFVGDPNDEFKQEYPDLTHFSKEYWKKYSDKNDLNAYLRIFSQFDFALFNQIKQLLPERVDEAMGLLVEPHALERVKVNLTKRPVIETPFYTGMVSGSTPSGSGTVPIFSGVINKPYSMSADSIYHMGGGGYADAGNLLAHLSGSDGGLPGGDPYESVSYLKSTKALDQRVSKTPVMLAAYSRVWDSSISNTGLANGQHSPWNQFGGGAATFAANDYVGVAADQAAATDKIIGGNYTDQLRFQFDTYLHSYPTVNDFNFTITNFMTSASYITRSMDLYGRLISTTDNRHGEHPKFFEDDGDNDRYIVNSASSAYEEDVLTDRILAEHKVLNFGLEGNMTSSNVLEFHDVIVPPKTKVTLEIFYFNPNADAINVFGVDAVIPSQTISSTNHTVHQSQVYDQRPSNIYKLVKNYFSTGSAITKYGKDFVRATSQSLGLAFSQSLEIVGYRDDFFQMTENQRYEGCKLIGPAINAPSEENAINQKPVVEIFATNPNTLTFNSNANATNPGNLLVR